MTRFFTLVSFAIAFAVPTLRAQDKDTHERLLQDTIKLMKDTTKILKDVQNKDQADKAKKEITALRSRMDDVTKRYSAIGAPTKEQEAELEKKYKVELEDAVKSLQTEAQRLLKTDFGKDLVAILQQKPKTDGK
jgi:hypothetical protein